MFSLDQLRTGRCHILEPSLEERSRDEMLIPQAISMEARWECDSLWLEECRSIWGSNTHDLKFTSTGNPTCRNNGSLQPEFDSKQYDCRQIHHQSMVDHTEGLEPETIGLTRHRPVPDRSRIPFARMRTRLRRSGTGTASCAR